MQRRAFLHLSALAAAGFSLDPADAAHFLRPAPPATPPRPWPAPFDSAPVLQNPTPDGITVTTAVNSLCTAWVEYGKGAVLDQRADTSRHGLLPLSARIHTIRLQGLKPATTYSYRIVAAPIDFQGPYKITRGTPVSSATHTFTTLDPTRSTASLSIINDTHEVPETLKGATSLLAANPSDLLFWNGDIFNDVRSDDQIVSQILRPADAPYAAGTPLCFVSGNHDVRGIHARSLDSFIDTPESRRFYTLRHGPIAIVVLDTGEDKPDTHEVYAGLGEFARYRDTQRLWLEHAIQSEAFRSAPFRLAILHIPLFGKAASDDSRNKWLDLLAAARIDASISGHVHEYLYTSTGESRPFAQLVGGGPKPEAATVIRAQADDRRMALLVQDLSGKELGNFEFKRT